MCLGSRVHPASSSAEPRAAGRAKNRETLREPAAGSARSGNGRGRGGCPRAAPGGQLRARSSPGTPRLPPAPLGCGPEGPDRGGGCPRWGSAAPRLLPGRGLGASAAPPATAPQLAAGPASPPALRGCSGVERSPRAGPPRAQPGSRTRGVPAEPRGLPEERMRWEDGTRGCKWRQVLAFFPPVVWVLLGNCE